MIAVLRRRTRRLGLRRDAQVGVAVLPIGGVLEMAERFPVHFRELKRHWAAVGDAIASDDPVSARAALHAAIAIERELGLAERCPFRRVPMHTCETSRSNDA